MSSLSDRSGHNEVHSKSQLKIEIYTTRHCSYCVRAKQLLQSRGVEFTEHAIDGDGEARRQMVERSGGRRTIPQIFIDDHGIGGFMELYQLDREGRLEILLRGASSINDIPER